MGSKFVDVRQLFRLYIELKQCIYRLRTIFIHTLLYLLSPQKYDEKQDRYTLFYPT